MFFYFPHFSPIVGMIFSNLTNSIIFQGGLARPPMRCLSSTRLLESHIGARLDVKKSSNLNPGYPR